MLESHRFVKYKRVCIVMSMRIKRLSCEECNCVKFKPYSRHIKYKCKCGHGDVWHTRHQDGESGSHLEKLRLLFKPLQSLFAKPTPLQSVNFTKECPVCLEILDDLTVLNCGHGFCGECTHRIDNLCPMCRTVVTNKIKVFI